MEQLLLLDIKKIRPIKEKLKQNRNKLEVINFKADTSPESELETLTNELQQIKGVYDGLEKEYEERKMKLESSKISLEKKIKDLKKTPPIKEDGNKEELEKNIHTLEQKNEKLLKERQELLQSLDFDGLQFPNKEYIFYCDNKEYKVNPSYKYQYGGTIMKNVQQQFNVPLDLFVKEKDIKMSKGKKSRKRARDWELDVKNKKRKTLA